jgi:hypothetical protein
VAWAAILGAACSDEEKASEQSASISATITLTPEPSHEPTLTVSPTPSASRVMGFEAFREFAPQIVAALQARDADFFLDRASEVEVACRGDEALGQCVDSSPGTVLRGIPGSAWQSDAYYIFTNDEYRTNLNRYFAAPIESATDEFGGGRLRLHSLGSHINSNGVEYLAMTTSIVDIYPSTGYPIGQNEREAHVFRFQINSGDWAFSGETAAGTHVTAADWLSGNCSQCYDYWEPWTD